MNAYFILPIIVGLSVVAQATLNRQMGEQYGLAATVAFNAVVFLVLSLGFFFVAQYNPTIVPEFMQVRKASEAGSFHWSFLLPGLCGFFIVLGFPWSIQAIGPSASFICAVAAQILISLGLEFFQSGALPHPWKIAGGVLVLLGGTCVIIAQ
jgi:uncharacterized membrane protein YdcZ (DUF606 family)